VTETVQLLLDGEAETLTRIALEGDRSAGLWAGTFPAERYYR
jgi:hypothetical protein